MAKSHYLAAKLLPSDEEMLAELLAWYALAQRDKQRFEFNFHWYEFANGECQSLAQKYNLTLHTTCQVVAAISPGKKWPINLRDAEHAIQAFFQFKTEAERIVYLGTLSYQTGYTWENTRNAWHILETGEDIPREREKTYSFAHNLEFPLSEGEDEEVTIDLHMAHILGKTKKRGPVNVNSNYKRLVRIVEVAANLLGILKKRIQAAVWGFRVDAFEAGYSVDSLCSLVESSREVEQA